MKGLSNAKLSGIDVELKEAVCDALVNALVERVSGTDERGRMIYGGSPRRGTFAGQLLPRFDVSGALDETTDIRIAAIGMDLVVRADAPDTGRGWRLFQMAFVLAHIPVFASRMAEWLEFHDAMLDEDGVSLLYFPTGGGKSEAFYGTLLFAMFLDRLRGKDRGVTAMIRYPLRLLTLQQAQRLLKLVVRAEMVRRRHKVGGWPFEMGFWVGSQNTPNHYGAFRAEIPLASDADFADDSALDGDTGDEDQRARGRRYARPARPSTRSLNARCAASRRVSVATRPRGRLDGARPSSASTRGALGTASTAGDSPSRSF